MTTLFLIDSDEWSNRYLYDVLAQEGLYLFWADMTRTDYDWLAAASFEFVINRVFPSAASRGQKAALCQSQALLSCLHARKIPMINSYEAFLYDCDKIKVARSLSQTGILVPHIFGTVRELDLGSVHYPCIVKPCCGGRSLDTHLVTSEKALHQLLPELPERSFLVQEYQKPKDGYTLRVEVVGDRILSCCKRSLNEQGLSSFHRGANYRQCPPGPRLTELCHRCMEILNMQMASFDLIENENGLFVIDVNATSNYAPIDLKTHGFNPLDSMARQILSCYRQMT